MLTGISVRVGNFSILPRSYLSTLIVLSELWNHYAAAVFRSRLKFEMIPIPRGRRIAGASRMNFVSLVTHGLSAASVFSDIVAFDFCSHQSPVADCRHRNPRSANRAVFTDGTRMGNLCCRYAGYYSNPVSYDCNVFTFLRCQACIDRLCAPAGRVGIYQRVVNVSRMTGLSMSERTRSFRIGTPRIVLVGGNATVITGDVLEVGAGIGKYQYLDTGGLGRFVALEPDTQLVERLVGALGRGGRKFEAVCGTLESIPAEEQFDTICYIDVLEHIEDDRAELNLAAAHLRPGGRVIVLSPAHQWLFTPFDAAIGHSRRYTRSMATAIRLAASELESCWYLDSNWPGYLGDVSVFSSNRCLRGDSFTSGTLSGTNRAGSGPNFGHSIGKTIVAVAKGGIEGGATVVGAGWRARRNAELPLIADHELVIACAVHRLSDEDVVRQGAS
jgi:2-polyprenyl-3-methyl-5-hydroxy-6-metoxy-1,4-benzoquinol methylase